MPEFVAIDFETANPKRASACAVGLTAFDSRGEITDSYYRLLKPHPTVNFFHPINVWVHGIKPEDVADAPEWGEAYPQIRRFIGQRPLVAHNMGFDGSVLNRLAELYGLEPLANRRLCTYRLAKKILAGQVERNSLDVVFEHYFPDGELDHHLASSDAEACGHIFARMLQEFGYAALEEMCPEPRRRGGQRTGLLADQLAAEELIARYGHSAVLEGERVVFTGTLQHGKRADIQALVGAIGGVAEKNLTKKTTLLVVGVPNPAAFAEGNSASRKLLKAQQLRDKGAPLRVLSEEEFFALLDD